MPVHPIRHGESAEKSARLPHIRERGSTEPGRAVANVLSSGGPLAVVCSIERKGCGSTLGQQELAVARAVAVGLGVEGSGSSSGVLHVAAAVAHAPVLQVGHSSSTMHASRAISSLMAS